MDLSTLFADINWSAVVAAAVGSMAWGFVWYHPSVAGKRWQKAVGLSKKASQSGADAVTMISMIVMSMLTATVLGTLLANVTGVVDGLFDATALGTGLAVTGQTTMYMFAKLRTDLVIIDGLFMVLNFALMGAIFGILAS